MAKQKSLTKEQQKEVGKQLSKQVKQAEQEIEQKLQERLFSKSKQTAVFFSGEFKKQTATAMIAAFGFIIALVWRDLIVKFIQENIQTSLIEKYPYIAQLYTAVIVTIIAVIGIALITRWSKKTEKA